MHLLACVVPSGPPFSAVFTDWLSMMAAPSASSGGCGLAALSLPQHGMQRVVGSLPGSIPAPSTEIMECSAPRRQVVGEHPPRAAGAQHEADGVDDLAPRILDRPPSRFGWRQQRFQKLPLPVADIASISRSFHASTLQPTPRFLPSYHYPSYTLFRHPLRVGPALTSTPASRMHFRCSRRINAQDAMIVTRTM